jgi:hypothetical protein
MRDSSNRLPLSFPLRRCICSRERGFPEFRLSFVFGLRFSICLNGNSKTVIREVFLRLGRRAGRKGFCLSGLELSFLCLTLSLRKESLTFPEAQPQEG